jgi:DNA-binding response OmpR family regulator
VTLWKLNGGICHSTEPFRSLQLESFLSDFLHLARESNRLWCTPPTRIMPRTFLVIDDNESVRESLKFLLLRRGYAVLVAEDGYEALRIASVNPIDAAMVDVNMPGMNGIEVCRALRERAASAGRDIAIWMMTGGRSPELVKMAREAGALDLLGKPFDLPSLYRRFEEQFAKREAMELDEQMPK